MQSQVSKSHDFWNRFLLEFTKELIRNTESYKKATIKKEIKKVVVEKKVHQEEIQKKETKGKKTQRKFVEEMVHEKERRDKNILEGMTRSPFKINEPETFVEAMPFKSFLNQRGQFQSPLQKKGIPPMLQLSGSVLPPTVKDIKPVPIPIEIDLKKINPLIKDPFVRIIECVGQNEKIIVVGTMGRKRTGIVLTKEEIDEIVKTFSESSKIPFNEGLNKVVFGKLIFSAITSGVIGSKFTIEKMQGPPIYR